jgi:3'-phosphoadenosine 5'-phosphosulfate sulfotransferase (PAPS reductase)/FAD synthetase
MDQKTALLYSKMPEHKFLISKTIAFIKWALLRVENPYLACSFGKDSSVMLHLVFNQYPNIPVKFLGKKETDLIDDYSGIVDWWKKRNVLIERITYLGWLEGGTKKGIAKNMKADDHDSFFVGIRKDESVARRITLKKDGKFFKMKDGKIRIAPMDDWTTKDIAAYMISNNLPVLNAYKREGFEARTTSNIPSKYPHEAIARLKDADITAYNKLIQKFPDAKYFT